MGVKSVTDLDAALEPRPEKGIHEALGRSEDFLVFQERLSRVAQVDRPVLLIGERGTGKELAAARLHFLSKRWQEPFVTLNCAALSPSLIESELFGHEAGAFTGARDRRPGRFEAADGGSLFLDEIGNIPVEAQEKILRVVEYGAFERVGASNPIEVDVRIIGATNADLPAMVAQGRFKSDLLDRLSFEVLFVPPLRERGEDIMLLARHFATNMAVEMGWDGLPEFTEKAAGLLEGYPWPGNVRELKNVVERAVYRSDDHILADDEIIFDPFESPYALPAHATVSGAFFSQASSEPSEKRPCPDGDTGKTLEPSQERSFDEAVRELEVHLIGDALRRSQYNQRKAAELLGLTYHQFRGLYRKYRDVFGGDQERA